MMYPYYYGGGSHWLFGFGIFGAILVVLFWILVIMLVVRLIRFLSGGSDWRQRRAERWQKWHQMAGGNRSALDILKERYAKGEIDKTEYEQKKKDLME